MRSRKLNLPTLKQARKAALSERWRIESEIRKIKKRGWLRPSLTVNPTDYVCAALPLAVDRGLQETQLVHLQTGSLAKWKRHSDRALRAKKSLTRLRTSLPITDLFTLAAKENPFRPASKNMSEARI